MEYIPGYMRQRELVVGLEDEDWMEHYIRDLGDNPVVADGAEEVVIDLLPIRSSTHVTLETDADYAEKLTPEYEQALAAKGVVRFEFDFTTVDRLHITSAAELSVFGAFITKMADESGATIVRVPSDPLVGAFTEYGVSQ